MGVPSITVQSTRAGCSYDVRLPHPHPPASTPSRYRPPLPPHRHQSLPQPHHPHTIPCSNSPGIAHDTARSLAPSFEPPVPRTNERRQGKGGGSAGRAALGWWTARNGSRRRKEREAPATAAASNRNRTTTAEREMDGGGRKNGQDATQVGRQAAGRQEAERSSGCSHDAWYGVVVVAVYRVPPALTNVTTTSVMYWS